MKLGKSLVYLILGVVLTYGIVRGFIGHAGNHANQIVSVVLGGYQRFMVMAVETTLSHLANLPESTKLDPKACEKFRRDLENSKGFFAVLALGDKDGNAICTADPNVATPLPTMKDRNYYKRVKDAQGLVVGDYAVSRTTGKQVLHFAYPVKNQRSEFEGFILGSVNLEWFADVSTDQYFDDRHVEVFAVDNAGKLLFAYPSDGADRGQDVVSAELISAILSGSTDAKLLKGHDGNYRVYGYKSVGLGTPTPMVVFAGVSLMAFTNLFVFTFLLIFVAFMLGRYIARTRNPN